MRVTMKTKVDTSGYKKLMKEVNNNVVKIGYFDTGMHWMNEGLTVADVAAINHLDSDWGKNSGQGFMLDESNRDQINALVRNAMRYFGRDSFKSILNDLGEDGVEAITFNIAETSSPENSESWANRKGFNDPLMYGSRTGDEPNLVSELKFKVGRKGDD